MVGRLRLLGGVLLGAVVSLGSAVGACGVKKGGLMLAIDTDMKAPKDVNVITLSVLVNNQVKVNYQGRVTPDGKVLLPATVALAEPEDSNAAIRIRVVAFQERRARVLRDVRTTIPTNGRLALLRLPLSFVNDGSGQGDLPAGFVVDDKPIRGAGDGGTNTQSVVVSGGGLGPATFGSDEYDPYTLVASICPVDQTSIDGECKDDYVDSSKLPDYDEALVGKGDDPSVCFDVKKCFANAQPVATAGTADVPDGGPKGSGAVSFDAATCALQLNGASASQLNVALVTPDTGECVRPGECFVPIDSGEGGWSESGGRVELPKSVCRAMEKKKGSRLSYSLGCAAKKAKNPICAETSPSDGGLVADASAPSGPAFFFSEDYTTSVRATPGPLLYFAGAKRFGRVGLAPGAPAPEGLNVTNPPQPMGQTRPWLITTTAGSNAAVLTSPSWASGWVVTAAPTVVEYAFLGPVQGGTSTANAFAWAVNGASPGVYKTEQDPKITPALMSGADNLVMIQGLGNQFVTGTGSGLLATCAVGAGECGTAASLGSRIDAAAAHPTDASIAYVLTQDSIKKVSVPAPPEMPVVLESKLTQTAGYQDGTGFYPRAIATWPTSQKCLFFSSAAGLEWMSLDMTQRSILVSAPKMPILGVAVAQRPGAASDASPGDLVVYYSVFGPMAQPGQLGEAGVWYVPMPTECQGPAAAMADSGL